MVRRVWCPPVRFARRYINHLGISPRQLVLGGAWFGVDTVCENNTPPTASTCLRATDDRDAWRPLLPMAWNPTHGTAISDILVSGAATTPVRLDNMTGSAWFNYRTAGGVPHQLWFDTPRSLQLKYGAARSRGARGVACFEADYATSLDSASESLAVRACSAAMWAAMLGADSVDQSACDLSPPPHNWTHAVVDRHLLVRPDALLNNTGAAELVVSRATRLGRPLLSEAYPWDVDWGNVYPNIAYDSHARLYKLWWSGLSACPLDYARLQPGCQGVVPFERCVCPHPGYAWSQWHPRQNVTGEWSLTYYAESADGLQWERPDTDLGMPLPFGAPNTPNTPNNVVLWAPRADSNRGVLLDTRGGTLAAQRFKMLGSFRNPTAGPPAAPIQQGLFGTAVSADGKHWGDVRPLPEWDRFHGGEGAKQHSNVSLKRDSHANAYWDERLRRYFAYVRVVPPANCRADPACVWHRIGVASSTDFANWTAPREMLRGSSEQQNMTYAFVGWRQDDTFLGVAMVYDNRTGRVRCELAASAAPDAGWRLVQPGVALIPAGPAGSFDAHICFAAAHPLLQPAGERDTGELEHRLYYGAADGPHSGLRHNSISLATLRPFRFAGWREAGGGSTVLTTRWVNVTGANLLVTVDCADTGASVRIGVVPTPALRARAHGHAPPWPLSRAECVPVVGNVTDEIVQWRSQLQNTRSAAGGPRTPHVQGRGAGATRSRVPAHARVPVPPPAAAAWGQGALRHLVGQMVQIEIELRHGATAFAYGFSGLRSEPRTPS